MGVVFSPFLALPTPPKADQPLAESGREFRNKGKGQLAKKKGGGNYRHHTMKPNQDMI